MRLAAPRTRNEGECMTPEDVLLVKGTWRKVLPIRDTAAELFYKKLFALDPGLQPLFKTDMKEQGQKLMAMISAAVNGLDNVETILPAVQDLGRRHAGYGVKLAHYDTVAAALLWTLEQGLGDAFTPQVRDAWVKVYALVAGAMKEAAPNAAAS
jgi:hemoglobin-like flavoprotein